MTPDDEKAYVTNMASARRGTGQAGDRSRSVRGRFPPHAFRTDISSVHRSPGYAEFAPRLRARSIPFAAFTYPLPTIGSVGMPDEFTRREGPVTRAQRFDNHEIEILWSLRHQAERALRAGVASRRLAAGADDRRERPANRMLLPSGRCNRGGRVVEVAADCARLAAGRGLSLIEGLDQSRRP